MSVRRYMEAARFGAPDELSLMTGPVPDPGSGELLVTVEAIGVNLADTMARRGEYRKDQVLPHTPGMEVAGTVAAGGEDTEIPPGTRVAVFLESGGGYASHVLAPESLTFPLDLDVDQRLVAASFLQGVTAWYAVHRYGRTKPRDIVLVSGAAGGLGRWVVQLAADAGATVVGLASAEHKRTHLLDIGCSAAFDPGDPQLTAVLRSYSPRGFDVIADGVGGPLFSAILPVLARCGRFVVTGSATQQPAVIDVRHLLPRGQTITGFVVRNVIDEDPREPIAALHEVLTRVADGRVDVGVEVLPLSQAAEAHVRLEAREVIGKLVLDPAL